MLKNIILLISIFFITVVYASGLKLPGDNFYNGWKKAGKIDKYYQNDLYGHINGGAELFLEFGFDSLLVQDYNYGKFEVSLEIYCLDSPEAALGIYLMKCGKENPCSEIKARNTGSVYQILAVKNQYFIQCNNFKGIKESKPAMVTLANDFLDRIISNEEIRIFELLPQENLIAGSELIIRGPYALQPIYTFGEGDILQLGGKIFGIVADYVISGDEKFTYLIIPYPEQKICAEVFKHVKQNLDPYLEVIRQSESEILFKDYRQKYGSINMKSNQLQIKIHLSGLPKS